MSKILKHLLYALAAVFFIMMFIAAFQSPTGAWPLVFAAFFFVFLANFDRISKISASTSGIEATLRHADQKVEELGKMIELTSEIQLSLLQQTGRMGGMSEKRKENFLTEITKLMEETGISSDKISEIRERSWNRYVRFDYAFYILGGSIIPNDPTGSDAIRQKWDSLRNFEAPGSPEEIKQFLNEIEDSHSGRRILLKNYDHYCSHGEHLVAEVWETKKSVPRLNVEKKE